MGSELLRRGGKPGQPPELDLWQRPELVRQIHQEQAAAGAEWLTLNSFGASPTRLARPHRGWTAAEAALRAATLAREAASLPLAGAVGPLVGGESHADYEEWIEGLAAAGVDFFLIETILRVSDGEEAVRLARRHGEVWASFHVGPDGEAPDGVCVEEAAGRLAAAGAAVVGVNCGSGPQSLVRPVERLVAASYAPAYAAPSAGLPRPALDRAAGEAVYPVTADEFAKAAIKFAQLGAAHFAGCCGVDACMIAAARIALDARPGADR